MGPAGIRYWVALCAKDLQQQIAQARLDQAAATMERIAARRAQRQARNQQRH